MKELLPNVNWKGECKVELLVGKSIRKVWLLLVCDCVIRLCDCNLVVIPLYQMQYGLTYVS